MRDDDPRLRLLRHGFDELQGAEYAFCSGTSDADDLYEFRKANNVTIVDPLADDPHYGMGYYAVYFLDPDGLELEEAVPIPNPYPVVGRPPIRTSGRRGSRAAAALADR